MFAFWLVFALAVLLLVPSHGAEIRRTSFPIAQIVAAGTSPNWSYTGGLVLAAWVYFLMQVLVITAFGRGLYPLTASTVPSLSSAFGITTAMDPSVRPMPGWVLAYFVPAVLFVLNLAVVYAARKTASSKSTRAVEAP